MFLPVNKVLDDLKTGPLDHISAIRIILEVVSKPHLNGGNVWKWQVYKTLPLPFDLLLH